MKKQATSTNGQDVQLRALEREAKAQRDLLESYLAKYREATTRENIDAAPADGRIISRASVSNTPAYPKKLPIVLIATLATLMLSAGAIATGELLRMTAPRAVAALRIRAGRDRVRRAVAADCDRGCRSPPMPTPPSSGIPRTIIPSDRARAQRNRATCRDLRGAGEAARKVTVLGTAAEREHHVDRADAGAADGAQRQGGGGRSAAASPTIRRCRSIRPRRGLQN